MLYGNHVRMIVSIIKFRILGRKLLEELFWKVLQIRRLKLL